MTETEPSSQFGLALGGGFVRGLAHLGVLTALEDHGLNPGWLAGTSAGAIAAAFAAFGMSASETTDALAELGWGTMTRAKPFGHFGWATNEGLEETLAVLGDVRIEDSEIPLGIVATDINTGNRVLLERGPVARAVRASCCVPGLYAPVEIDGKLLVDGALVENVPARAAREMGAPVVVAVSLGFALPFDPVESWIQVMANAFDIAVNSQMRFEILSEADVLIDPDVEEFSKMRAKDRDAVIQAGKVRAEEAIPALVELLEAREGGAVTRWMRSVRERLAGAVESGPEVGG
ncbi:MAG: patatin-like phospholipase family protein [Gemmatimonadota bacterium]|jgi:NTE family protein